MSPLKSLDEMGASIGIAHGWYATCRVCGARVRVRDADGAVDRHLHIVDGNTMRVDRHGEGKTLKEEGRALFGGFPWCAGEGILPLGTPTPDGVGGEPPRALAWPWASP